MIGTESNLNHATIISLRGFEKDSRDLFLVKSQTFQNS